MVENDKNKQVSQDEKILDFEDAKDMTVGQAVRKHEEIKAGITEEDSVLDRYIKQHREEIEADKYETLINMPAITDEDLAQAETVTETEGESVADGAQEPAQEVVEGLGIHKVSEVKTEIPVAEIESSDSLATSTESSRFDELEETIVVAPIVEEVVAKTEASKVEAESSTPASPTYDTTLDDLDIPEEYLVEDEDESGKKKLWIWALLATLLMGILTVAYLWMNNSQKTKEESSKTSSSSTTAQTTTASSKKENTEDATVVGFEALYKTFFTDASMTKLKNSQFSKLPELKKALDKIDNKSAAYKTAKEKYDKLEKAIKSIQTVNGQFDKPALVDGKLDTTVTAKAGANFKAETSGIQTVDDLINSAVNFGKSQQTTTAPADNGANSNVNGNSNNTPDTNNGTSDNTNSADSTVNTAPTSPSNNGNGIATNGVMAGSNPLFGIPIPAGVTLQRNLSRVPYDWDKIKDANNPAWTFNEGVLEKIIATSQQRGYITGNQYILERVNIINGRGYYNLYKPDGTYLFSMNCKTGYFVGNGAGHSDALDF